MTLAGIWTEWTTMRYRLFDWRINLALQRKLVLCFGVAFFTRFLAQILIPLSFGFALLPKPSRKGLSKVNRPERLPEPQKHRISSS